MQRKTTQLNATKRSRLAGNEATKGYASAQRRASVLVLVMTLLGVLFVIGVAFLATMNFEAEMIAAQSHQNDRSTAVSAASDQIGGLLQDIFANPTGGEIPYAELPQVNSTFSPVEPMVLKDWGPDGLKGTPDDSPFFVGFSWVTDTNSSSGISATNRRRDFYVDSNLPQGWQMVFYGQRCLDGPAKGQPCTLDVDCQGSICRAPMLSDADGDGINDSALVLAGDLGLSQQQVAAIAAQVNPPSNPGGRVFAALRVVPHGGMVHLNYAHPKMIENLFDLTAPLRDYTGSSAWNYFRHSPTQDLVFYSPLIEEALLRNRGLLPIAASSPSLLQGDPFSRADDFAADMPFALMWPTDTSGGSFQTLSPNDDFAHRFEAFTPCSLPDGDCFDPNTDLWQVRMEPFTARSVSSPASLLQYDRRHLSTTVSHDDLLARPTTVPAAGVQRADMAAKMRTANSSIPDPDNCYLPFEYADYPHDLPNASDPTIGQQCECPANGWCDFDERKGRLKLSLPWVQRMLDAGAATLDPLMVSNYPDNRVWYAPRLIQDVYAAMLANLISHEPTYCTTANDCPFVGGDPSRGRQGCDAALNRCICTTSTDCQPGEYCVAGINAQGYCTPVANFWDNQECTGDAMCASGEFCDSNLLSTTGDLNGLCADSWSELPRSQARLSRTAASLAANTVDFMDADLLPTRIGVRSFDFTRDLCRNSPNPGEFCRPGFSDCSSGTCGNNPPDPATVVGRDEFDPFFVYKPRYVYGLEPQPFITAVSTVAEVGASGAPELTGWAVELFNPFDHSVPQQNPIGESQYWLVEIPAGSTGDPLLLPSKVLLTDPTNQLPRHGLGRPFTVFYYEGGATPYSSMPASSVGTARPVGSGNTLKLASGSMLYLVWRYRFAGDTAANAYTEIVIDQFQITGSNIGIEGNTHPDFLANGGINPIDPNLGSPFVYVDARGVPDPTVPPNTADSIWLAAIPAPNTSGEVRVGTPTATVESMLGTYHAAPDPAIYPVAMGHAGTDRFDTAFPTPGSLLLPLRLANRSLSDYVAPRGHLPVKDLAFTASLVGASPYTVLLPPHPGSPNATSPPVFADVQNVGHLAEYQIDNGRLPIFDVGVPITSSDALNWGNFSIHHVPQQLETYLDSRYIADPSKWPGPGGVRSLPWGQLVFDYFSTLPLSNPGPYWCLPGDPSCLPINSDPLAKPRVDQDGLRVHGRLNLNAAPWKALAGLPMAPIARLPVDFQTAVRDGLGLTMATDFDATVLGELRAQAVVAYREARELAYVDPVSGVFVTTGDYSDAPGTLANGGGYRGWKNPTPQARRGTGFMSVGELANIRNGGASAPQFWFTGQKPAGLSDPLIDALPETAPDNNSESFIAAAAPLIALNEWASVRSHVFTVYGVFRGEENPDITDGDQFTQHLKRQQDIDSRAIRFQETIDRLPVFLGQPLPQRIGQRVTGSYTDYRNN